MTERLSNYYQAGVLDRPVFFIGAPRSGTTVTYEAFAQHRALGWLSNYSAMMPTFPLLNLLRRVFENRFYRIVGHKKQYGKTLPGNRFLPQTSECYEFWDHYSGIDFSRDYLLGHKASEAQANRLRKVLANIVHYQARARLSAKLTGPPRIGYLNSVFPDGLFVHVVRDGRAVVQSLMNVGFWKAKGGFDGPFWKGGLTEEDLAYWKAHQDPRILAALQWRRIIDITDEESRQIAPERLMTVRYEDFISDPHALTRRVFQFCGLADDERAHDYIRTGVKLVNMNYKFETETDELVKKAHELMSPQLRRYGYLGSTRAEL